MKTVSYYLTLFLASFVMLMATAQAGDNEDVCKEWCKTVKECKFCLMDSNCGSGNTSIASVSIFSGNKRAYGCATSAVGRFEPTSNETMCLRFLTVARSESLYRERMKEAYCSSRRSCSKGFSNAGSFTGGAGRNMHACSLKSVTDKSECDDYCQRNAQCDDCINKKNCGSGYSRMALFGDWSACEKNGGTGSNDEAECREWCKSNVSRCDECMEKRNCGYGYSRTVLFGDWAACKLNERGRGGKANERECKKWCEDNSNVCARCWQDRNCGDGHKRINTFNENKGENWYACEKR